MTVDKFDPIVKKITKQFTSWNTQNKSPDWEKQKEYLTELLIRNKLLKTDGCCEFWRAVGSTCDYIDDPGRKDTAKDWQWHVDVVFCVLYMSLCMKKWRNKKVKKDEDE